jgi:hypothetical protein
MLVSVCSAGGTQLDKAMDKMRSIAVKRDSIRQSFRADQAAADAAEAAADVEKEPVKA